jgi:GGDEF domain-containing protein
VADLFGHRIGETALKLMADRVHALLKPTDSTISKRATDDRAKQERTKVVIPSLSRS